MVSKDIMMAVRLCFYIKTDVGQRARKDALVQSLLNYRIGDEVRVKGAFARSRVVISESVRKLSGRAV